MVPEQPDAGDCLLQPACGLFSGKVRSDEERKAAELLGPNGMKGYGYPQNFERLRRCEKLAQEHGCSIAQIAMAYIYCQPMNCFAVVRTASPQRMGGKYCRNGYRTDRGGAGISGFEKGESVMIRLSLMTLNMSMPDDKGQPFVW